MKNKLLPAALVAAVGLTLAPGLARAVEPNVSYSPGDLILGFQLSGDNDVEVDLGSYTKFTNATSAFNVTFGLVPADQVGAGATVTSLNSDLVANFGAGWASNSALQWGIVGDVSSGVGYTLYFTLDSNNPTIPTRPSNSGSILADSSIGSLAAGIGSSPSTANSTAIASVLTSTANSWDSFNPGTSFSGVNYPVEQSFGIDGPTNSVLNLFQDAANGRNGGGAATELGSFTLDSSGDLTYTPASVPEPSTWLSIISGALMLGFIRHRRSARLS